MLVWDGDKKDISQHSGFCAHSVGKGQGIVSEGVVVIV